MKAIDMKAMETNILETNIPKMNNPELTLSMHAYTSRAAIHSKPVRNSPKPRGA